MKKIAIFASGMGTNFTAIADSIKEGSLNAQIAVLVCDKPKATVIRKAEKLRIPTFVFSAKDYNSKAEYETEIAQLLKEKKVEWLVLAGYMRLIGETLLATYENKIVNIHPALLPKFPGKDAIRQSFEAKEKIVGATIHYVDSGMDTGKIISQASIKLTGRESLETVAAKIHAIEHILFPQTLSELLEGEYDNE
jgi:phosphoribosylglycinamide formyltransferase, formyltetrahydrofolate-dependent